MTGTPRPVAEREPIQPNFLFVGMPKAGSTWLYEALRSHPDVFVPDSKGLNFFDRHFDRGVEWYLRHFAAAGSAGAIGELSHDVYAHAEAAHRIHDLFPAMRLMMCLREPAAAARSVLSWWSTHTSEYGSSVEEMVAHPHYHRLFAYRENIERFLRVFDRSRLRIFFYEDLRRDARNFIREVFEYLAVDPTVEPPCLNIVVNPSRPPRFPGLTRLVYGAGDTLRSVGAGTLVERFKVARLPQLLLYKDALQTKSSQDIDVAAMRTRAAVRADYPAIEALAARALPVEWTEKACDVNL